MAVIRVSVSVSWPAIWAAYYVTIGKNRTPSPTTATEFNNMRKMM
jgi:hypothetical protein